MNIISAYHQVGTYRGAAELCGTTHKTVKRVVERGEAGGPPPRPVRPRNFDAFTGLVATRVEASGGRISAKRLLPIVAPRAIRALPATFGVWWLSRKCCGAKTTRVPVARRCGRRVSIW
jgi:hypothetical protein